MNLSCSRESLFQAINMVNKAVSNRTTLPILECILFTADETGFYLTANDLELGIQSAPIDAQIEKNGVVALEARIITDIVRRVNGETVSFSVDEKNVASIACGTSTFQIVGQNGDEFPSLPEVEKNQNFVLSQNDLKNAIRQTIFSISQDESKPVLTGEYIEFKTGILKMVSVDGYRISYRNIPLSACSEETNVIIPGKTLGEINKILSQEEETVNVYFTDKHILFDLQSGIVVSRLIEGDYIKYQQSFTDDYKTKILCKRDELLQALERASLVSRDTKKTPVRINMENSVLTMTAKAELGNAHEEISIEQDGDALEIAFNPRYLIEALRVIEDSQVSIQFTTNLSPCIIKPLEGDTFGYLILPLRM